MKTNNSFICGHSYGTKVFLDHVCGNCIKDKCHYCDNEGLYTQPIDYDIVSVCKKHFVQDVSS
jgi:hypothetical protein